ncbi:hypothetical protein M514_04927 [Trichuris suis]|uniref:Protein, SNF2 family n=1 Tax=Trichuris suis TaxID=68888 RepID=A0A085MAA4_9BILA|nr:hypothetical protein M513_04927 [Trichuris suis]KFD71229.1 hypothetical protein M514_04927 [Trichuris suis]
MGIIEEADNAATDSCLSTLEVQEPTTSRALSADSVGDGAVASDEELGLRAVTRLIEKEALGSFICGLRAVGTNECTFSEPKTSSAAARINTGTVIPDHLEPLCPCSSLPDEPKEQNEVLYIEEHSIESAEAGSSRSSPSDGYIDLTAGSSRQKRTSCDGEPSLVKTGAINSEKDTTAAIRQEATIMRRIGELRKMGCWSQSLLPKCSEPRRLKSYWDNFIAEACWMSKDFAEERKLKKFAGKKMAAACSKAVRDKSERTRRLYLERQKQRKRVSSQENKLVRQLWLQVDKIVAYRNDAIIKAKREKALNAHLNIILGDPEKSAATVPKNHERSLTAESGTTDGQEKEVSLKANASKVSGRKRRKGFNSARRIKQPRLDEPVDDELASKAAPDQSPSRSASSDNESETSGSEVDEPMQSETEPPEKSDDWIDYEKLQSTDSAERQGQLACIAEAAEKLQPKGYTLESVEEEIKVPFLLKHKLREYQLVGLHWLITLNRKGLNGILADEMGLGKTIQTIALLAHLACENFDWGPHLVIVPTSVLLNWEMEFKKWCPSFKILTYYGHLKERKEKRRGWCKDNNFHICITSYKLVVQDYSTFRRRKWHYMILDEAQNIKNFKSMRWQALLNFNTTRRLLLTGTPLQNSLMELWSLMHFLMPNVFQSHSDFREWFSNPLTNMIDGSVEFDEQLVKRLHKVLRPFLLRRLKSEVERQLPKKFEHVMMCELSKRQRYLYNEFMSRSSTRSQLASGNVINVIGILMQLRKVCNHPNLFEPRPVVSPLWMPAIMWRVPGFCCDMHLGSVGKVPVWLRSTSWRKLMRTECRTLDTLTVSQSESRLASSQLSSSPSTIGSPRSYHCFRTTLRENAARIYFDSPNPRQFRAEIPCTLKQCHVPLKATTKIGANMVNLNGQMKVTTSYIRASVKVNDGESKKEVLLRLVRKTPVEGAAAAPPAPPVDPTMPKLSLPVRIVESRSPVSSFSSDRPPALVKSQIPVLNSIPRSSSDSTAQPIRPCKAELLPDSDLYEPTSSPIRKTAKYDYSTSPSSTASEHRRLSVKTPHESGPSSSAVADTTEEEDEDMSLFTEAAVGSLCEAVRHLLEAERANPWVECDLHVEEELKAMKEHIEFIGRMRALRSPDCTVGCLETFLIPKMEVNLNFRERLVAQWQYIHDRAALYIPGVCTTRVEPVISHRFPYEDLYEASLEKKCQEYLNDALQPYREFLLSRSLLFPESSLIEYDCGKLHVLANILRDLRANGHRCLIFTQMARMLDILEIFLSHHGYKYLRLDGATGVERRQVLMERFNEDRRILCFILSTRSGGLGVNLTGADTVIFYDSDWNPTMDAQAQDRCHRIGQTRDVNIYRLICARTVEENILIKANQKRKLGELAIEEGCFRPNFLRETIREMFYLPDADTTPAGGENVTDGELQQAMADAEDDTDVVAAKVASAEAAFDKEDFEENEELQQKQLVPSDANVEQLDPEVAKVDLEMKEMLCELTPIERFGLMNLSSRRQHELFEELREAEDEVEQYRRSFAETRKQELELEKARAQELRKQEFQLTYDAQDEHCKVSRSFDGQEEDGPLCRVAEDEGSDAELTCKEIDSDDETTRKIVIRSRQARGKASRSNDCLDASDASIAINGYRDDPPVDGSFGNDHHPLPDDCVKRKRTMIAEDSSVMPIWDPPTPPLSDGEDCYATVNDDAWGPYLRTPMGELPLCVEDTEQKDFFIAAGLPSPTSPVQEKQPSSAEAVATVLDGPGEARDSKENLVSSIQLSAASIRSSIADHRTFSSILEPLSADGSVAAPLPKNVTDDCTVCYLGDRLLAPSYGVGRCRNANVNWDYVSEYMLAQKKCVISPRKCLTQCESRRSLRGQQKTELGPLVCSTYPPIESGGTEAVASPTLCSVSLLRASFGAQYGFPNAKVFGMAYLSSAKEESSSTLPPLPSDLYLGKLKYFLCIYSALCFSQKGLLRFSEGRCIDCERLGPQVRQYALKYQQAARPDASKCISKLPRLEENDEERYLTLASNSMMSNLTFLSSVGATHHPAAPFPDTDAKFQASSSSAKTANSQFRQVLSAGSQPYMLNVGNGMDMVLPEYSVIGQPVDSSGFSRSHGHFMRVKPTQLASRSAATTGGSRRELGSRGTLVPIISSNHSYQSQVQVRPKPVFPHARMHVSAQRGFTAIQHHQRIRSPTQLSGVRHVSFSGQSPILPSCSRPISIRSIRPRQPNTLIASPPVGHSEARHLRPQLRSIPSINMIMSGCPQKSLIDDVSDSSANR